MTTWLIGNGALHRELITTLEGHYDAAAASPDDASLGDGDTVVLARDGWDPDRDPSEQRRLREHPAAVQVLPVRVVGEIGLVGPWVRPGQPGCQVCAERRRRLWRRQNSPTEPLEAAVPALPLTRVHLAHLAHLTVETLTRELLGAREVHVTDASLRGQVHRVTPLPGCPECSAVPDDSSALARIDLHPRPQPDPEQFRVRPTGLSGAQLRTLLHDWRYGPVGHVFRSENSAMALTSAEVALTSGAPGEGGHGRARTYPQGETIAFYEALERLVSASPHGRRTVVRGAARQLTDAIDVGQLGLHPETSHEIPGFAFHRWSPTTETDWVWGWRLASRRPALVPEHLAYWNVDTWGRERRPVRFLYDSSNGCALGSCIEEATLYGIFEVVERDAFLTTWYTRRQARQIEVDDQEVPELTGMRALLDKLGYDLRLYDVTTEIPIPAVLSLVVRRDDDGPVAFFAAGAHCNPRRALISAANEAVTNAVIRNRMPQSMRLEQEREARHLIDDPARVRTLHDHTILYSFPETRSWWSFLDHDQASVTLADAWGDWRSRWVRPDLTDTLREVVSVLDDVGLDPIVVDQTDPRLGDGSDVPAPAVVKVIIPGTVPMTFGHAHRRIRGLSRLESVPRRLGYAPDLPPEDVPPHPFP